MEIRDYIEAFHKQSHRKIGEGLISIHTNDKSEVINYNGKIILNLSQNDYCIGCKNGNFLILHSNPNAYYDDRYIFKIVNQENQEVFSFISESVSLSEKRGNIIFRDEKDNCKAIVLNYKGEEIFSFKGEKEFKNATIIDDNIIAFEFYSNFRYYEFESIIESNFIIVNISNNKILIQGQKEDKYDLNAITEVEYFELPILLDQKQYSFEDKRLEKNLIPVIKYTLVKPDFDDDEKPIYKKNVNFCDFFGNIVKTTEFSSVSNKINGFYKTNKNELEGVLDDNFEEVLPCRFRYLVFSDNDIQIENYDWEWQDFKLDKDKKRFVATKKTGEQFLLPYQYYSCATELIPGSIGLRYAYRYNEKGEYCTGIMNNEGEELYPARYNHIHELNESLFIASNFDVNDEKELLTIKDNSVIVKNKYLEIERNQHNLDDTEKYYRVRVYNRNCIPGVKVGIVDKEGTEILPPIYDHIYFPSQNRICYIKNGIAGWYDIEEMSMHEYPKFDLIEPFFEDNAIVTKGPFEILCVKVKSYITGWDYEQDCEYYQNFEDFDPLGDLKIRFKYSDNKVGLIDSYGKIIIELKYDSIKRLNREKSLFAAKLSGKWGLINEKEKVIVPFKYDTFSQNFDYSEYKEYRNCVARFNNYGRVGGDYYDKSGNLIKPNNTLEDDTDYEDNYDYERDTYYALGGDDYDAFREKGGSIDDMMDGKGF